MLAFQRGKPPIPQHHHLAEIELAPATALTLRQAPDLSDARSAFSKDALTTPCLPDDLAELALEIVKHAAAISAGSSTKPSSGTSTTCRPSCLCPGI